jgi:hypothetical protein
VWASAQSFGAHCAVVFIRQGGRRRARGRAGEREHAGEMKARETGGEDEDEGPGPGRAPCP